MPDYHDLLEDRFRLKWVSVTEGDTVYEGLFRETKYGNILLDDATKDGEPVGSAVVHEPDGVHLADPDDAPDVEPVDPGAVAPLRYSPQNRQSKSFKQFVSDVRGGQSIGHCPIVAPSPRGEHLTDVEDPLFVTVEGHKRLACAREAGLESVPVIVEDLTPWEITQRFMDDHIPVVDTVEQFKSAFGRESQNYTRKEFLSCYDRLVEDWDRSRLLAHPGFELLDRFVDRERTVPQLD